MLNAVIIQGNLTGDPDLKLTQSGIPYARFTVAINERTKDGEKTHFIPVVAWRQTGEFVNRYFKKGSQIAVEGKMSQRTYTDNDGKNRSIIEVVAKEVHFCGTKGGSAPPQAQPQQQPQPSTGMSYSTAGAEFEEILSDGDVPF